MGFLADNELNVRLALAIGWKPKEVHHELGSDVVHIHSNRCRIFWQRFDYKDEVVAFRIAKKFDCFPFKQGGPNWLSSRNGRYYSAGSPQAAIALAVIGKK